MGDRPQGVAGDCNSLAETHAWFDSRVAHHVLLPQKFVRNMLCGAVGTLCAIIARLIEMGGILECKTTGSLAAPVSCITGIPGKLERAKRFELSTLTLAR